MIKVSFINQTMSECYLNKSCSAQNNNSASAGKSIFLRLLSDYLTESGITSDVGKKPDVLDREQMAILLEEIKNQMNKSLLRAILNNEEQLNYYSMINLYDFGKETKPPSTDASKNRHHAPINLNKKDCPELESVIRRASDKFDVDASLIRSVIKAESDFNPKATSVKGAMGLMQLMPETAKDMGVENAYDTEENVMGGTKYIKMLLDRYGGNIDLVLAAYNWGMGNVEKKVNSLPDETIQYINLVKSYQKQMKA